MTTILPFSPGAIDEAATAEPLPYAQWVLRSAPAAKVSATEHDP